MARTASQAGPSVSTLVLGSLLTYANLATATVSFKDSPPTKIQIGGTYKIEWTTDSNPVRVTLINNTGGSKYSLMDICGVWINNNVTSACTNADGEAEWTVSADTPVPGVYSLLATAADGSEDTTNTFNVLEAGSITTTSSSTSSEPSSTGSVSQSTTETSSGAATTTPGGDSGNSGTSSGLSTGAMAGIGVGAGLGGLAILGGLGFLFFRMGKKAGKDKPKDDGSGGEEGNSDKKADLVDIPKGPELMGDSKQPIETKDTGIAEMPAPNIIHEAPDYKLRLDTPGEKSFFSELDATGGSFVLPGSGRPSTEKADNASDKGSDAAIIAPKIVVSDEDDKADSAEATTSAAAAATTTETATETADKSIDVAKTEEPVESETDEKKPETTESAVEKSTPATESEEAAAGPSSAPDAPTKEASVEEAKKEAEEKKEEETKKDKTEEEPKP